MKKHLLTKYDVPAPRYTSYPTVPYWDDTPPLTDQWKCLLKQQATTHPEISLYIHLPYCESLCTFCGCNKRITKNHNVESPYIDAVLKEWQLYAEVFPKKPIIKEIHLGGGTPTFFAPQELVRLTEGIFRYAQKSADFEFGFEAHPNSTTPEHLQQLYNVGYRRLSIGVQDFSDRILQLINRHQTAEQVTTVTEMARQIGYSSVNYDLVFGLPKQSEKDIIHTIYRIRQLKPDRIAFYSYAHVPWIKPSQRAYNVDDLPKGKEKRNLYEIGRTLLDGIGYHEIGLDHFALKHDSLYTALEDGQLHRNFMGYTPKFTGLSIGLGVSAISDSWSAYIQNEKKIEPYFARLNEGKLPFFRGHVLNREDLVIRQHILNLMCRYQTKWNTEETPQSFLDGVSRLKPLESDQMVNLSEDAITVTPTGKPFVRNICKALDARLWRKEPSEALFSQAV